MSPASPKPHVALNLCPSCHTAINAVVSPSVLMPCPQCGHRLSVWSLPDGLQVFGERSAERVMAIFGQHVSSHDGIPMEKITPAQQFIDLDADSLDVAEILMDIEGDLEITFGDRDYDVRTVGDVIRAVDSCLSAKKE